MRRRINGWQHCRSPTSTPGFASSKIGGKGPRFSAPQAGTNSYVGLPVGARAPLAIGRAAQPMVGMMTFEDVASELYGLPLDQFTARRNDRAQQARMAGDRKLAAQIKGLRRPTLAAWLGNQLVREHREEVGTLLALGQALRSATAELRGDELRQLSGQQRRVLAVLVGQARAIAEASGQPVSQDAARGLEDTLRAALADPDAAAAFVAGRLVAGLTPPALGGFPAAPTAHLPTPAAESSTEREAARLAQAQTDALAAASDAALAHAALREATEAVEAAEGQVRSAAEQVRQLSAQLDAAIRSEAEANTDARARRASRDQADRVARDAQQRLQHAQARVAALKDQQPAPRRGGGS